MTVRLVLSALALTLSGATAVSAQEASTAAPVQAPVEAPAAAAPAPTGPRESWYKFSSSTTRAYLVDVGSSMSQVNGVTSVRVARVPLDAAAGDYRHTVDTFEIRCAAKQSRATVSTTYGEDGAQSDQYDDPSPWEAFQAESLDGYLAKAVCDGERDDAAAVASVKVFIDGGRE